MKDNISQIQLSGIRSFNDYCRQFRDVVYLTIGEPDFDTPEVIKDAAIRALHAGRTHYPPAIGTPDFRDAVAVFESKRAGYPITRDEVIAVNGSTEGLALAIWSTLNEGDEIIVPVPSFPMYLSQITLIGAKAVLMQHADIDFQIDDAHLTACLSDKTKAILFASPNNPTGAILNEQSLRVLYEHAKRHPDFRIILDDVYLDFSYDGPCPTLRGYEDIRDQVILVQSLSKSFAMTGWRLGYVVANKELIQDMHKLHQNMVTGVTTFIQDAGIVALNYNNQDMIDEYKQRRDYIYDRLAKMGLDVQKPAGAFYIFPNIQSFGMTSLAFAKRCLTEAGVAVIPGIYFGQEGYVRLSFCYAMEELEKAMDRLAPWIHRLQENI